MTINEKIRFSLEASLVDLNNKSVPKYNRSSMMLQELSVDGNVQLYPTSAFHPAFSSESAAFLIEPEAINLLTQNMNIGDNVGKRAAMSLFRTTKMARLIQLSSQSASPGLRGMARIRLFAVQWL